MNETEERHQRKKAIRLWLKGVRTFIMLKIVPRSRAWLCKCKKRYRKHGWKGLQSQSRKPKRNPYAYSSTIRRLVVQAYRRVQKRPWGLRGVSAVRRELRVTFRLQPTPSTSTLKALCVTMCETTEADQLMSKVKESRYVSRLKFRIKFQ
ncbi:MAG: hypothetical protein AAB571_07000 [Chloroflexota bacterium]